MTATRPVLTFAYPLEDLADGPFGRITRTALCIALLSVMSSGPAIAQDDGPCDITCHSRSAADAAAEGRFDAYLEHARAILALAPSHPGAVYAVARGLALTGDAAGAEDWLRRLVAMGDTRDISGDPAFADLRRTPAFASIERSLVDNGTPQLRGQIVLSIPDPDLLPESFAYDSERQRWLIGSQWRRKVIAVAADGSVSEFADASDMLRVVGMHADSTRDLLWIATWDARYDPNAPDVVPPSRTRLFKADLASGRILARYAPADSLGDHMFNDLVIAPNGDIYITDTSTGWLYRVRASADTLEVFLAPDPVRWTGANGIAMAPDGRTLWVAYFGGIAWVDVASRQINWMGTPDTVSTAVVDGLYYVDGSLVGVQAVPTMRRVIRYQLSGDGRSILGATVLERGPPLTSPSTGQVVGSRFYYIPNAQYERLGDDGVLIEPEGPPVPSTVRVVELEPHTETPPEP